MKTKIRTDGTTSSDKLDLRQLLLLKYQGLTNKSQYIGKYDIPALYCNTDVYPDYIALYSEKSYYKRTELTAVGFFQFDNEFNGQHGLYNAIYYNNKTDLIKFKKRFEGVKFVFSPDYSLLEDTDEAENIYRLKKARVVSLWFIHEIGAIVIPLITFPSLKSIDYYLDGLDNSSVVGISTKRHISERVEYQILCATIEYLVKNKHNLKAIVVYDVCGNPSKTNAAFNIAVENGIQVIIPNNALKAQNAKRWSGNYETL